MKQYNRRKFFELTLSGAAFAGIGILPLMTGCKRKSLSIDSIAESYVKLALQVSQYDPIFLDTYFGPDAWKQTPKSPIADLVVTSRQLSEQLQAIQIERTNKAEYQRHSFLSMQLAAVMARVDLLAGKKMDFNEEFSSFYGVQPEQVGEEVFAGIINEVENLLPGKGSIAARVQELASRFALPKDKLGQCVAIANEEARRNTLLHIQLPPDELLQVKYPVNVPYSAACWYLGNHKSVYEVNLGVPIELFWIIDNACHEAYPGHHTYFV